MLIPALFFAKITWNYWKKYELSPEAAHITYNRLDGYITLPGGFGTLDELFEALTLGQLHIEQKPIGLLNVNGFFDAILLQLDKMVDEGYLKQDNRNMLLVGTSVAELMKKMHQYTAPKISHIIQKVVS